MFIWYSGEAYLTAEGNHIPCSKVIRTEFVTNPTKQHAEVFKRERRLNNTYCCLSFIGGCLVRDDYLLCDLTTIQGTNWPTDILCPTHFPPKRTTCTPKHKHRKYISTKSLLFFFSKLNIKRECTSV